MVNQIRQGDVLLRRVEAPQNAQRVLDENGQPIQGLRVDGERTGHAHVLPARVYEAEGRRVLFLERPTILRHEEHAAIEVPAGWWEPVLQSEYRPVTHQGRRWRREVD